MAFLGYEELEKLIKEKEIISADDFNPDLLEAASYQLTLGSEVYVTNSNSGKKEILDDKNTTVDIKPGQFALLLINEKISIPKDILAFIALKFKVKAKGLVNISGFHVDPGFEGKLVYSVYNAGASTIVLEKGIPYFSIWFSKLTDGPNSKSKVYNEKHEHQFQKSISSKYIEALKGDLASPNELREKIKRVESKKDYNKWLFSILIGVSITFIIKLGFFDLSSYTYKKGYKDALQYEEIKRENIQEFKEHKIDSIIKVKIDELMNHSEGFSEK